MVFLGVGQPPVAKDRRSDTRGSLEINGDPEGATKTDPTDPTFFLGHFGRCFWLTHPSSQAHSTFGDY